MRNIEERRLDTTNKAVKIDEDTKKNWLSQTNTGFDMIRLQEGLDDAMNQPLPASSLASEFDFEAAGEKILASAAASVKKETGDDSKDGEGKCCLGVLGISILRLCSFIFVEQS